MAKRGTKRAVEAYSPFAVGTAVKYSQYGLASLRNRWLDAGEWSRKTSLLRAYEAKQALRGEVVAVIPNDFGGIAGYAVRWNTGSESHTASYLLAKA